MKTLIHKISDKGLETMKGVNDFLDSCTTYYDNPNFSGSGVVYLNPTVYRWGKPANQNFGNLQLIALKIINDFIDHYNLLFIHFTSNQIEIIQINQKYLIGLIERSVDAPSTIKVAKDYVSKTIKEHLTLLYRLINKEQKVIVIPDTNSLIKCPDPLNYISIAGVYEFDFVFTPTITKELDKLKTVHRDDNFRSKVNSVINRIKGYRTQGSLLQGVKYNKKITIRAIANEPKFDNLLKWLDPNNDDDRSIASILQIIISNPNDIIILVTSDINLQNKAELALLNFNETPTPI
ncbi:MAG: twitching motility protein PilT [Saprospiraceae bacterium]|nr:twitching motility protein PilT [Saprospiraceae bacterium]